MVSHLANEISDLETALSFERARLVRFCTRLTGNADAAEDLAQETLLEAWRHAHTLRDPARQAQWLSGIARNVCLRWVRSRGRELARIVTLSPDQDAAFSKMEAWPVDGFDLEIELERSELATLLDRAMALLPPATRAVLVERYIQESPHAEIAARLGLNEGAVKVKLHRGKLALRRVLTTSFPDEAAAYGLIDTPARAGQETRIWCSICGQRRLTGRFDRSTGELSFACPNCAPEPAGYSYAALPEVFKGIKGYKAALARQMVWADEYYRQALVQGIAPCLECGHPARLRICLPEEAPPPLKNNRGVRVDCDVCKATYWASLPGIALNLPAGRRFWRQHSRVHVLPEREIEVAGSPAIVTSFQSVTNQAKLEVITIRDTLEVIAVHGAPDK